MPRHAREVGRIVVACGGFRSGSTLQYNLAGEYVERIRAGRRVGYVTPPQAAQLHELPSVVDALGLAVAKSHDLAPGFRDWSGAEAAWNQWADEGRLLPVYCVRDFRDVIASMARKFKMEPTDVIDSSFWQENIANMDAWLALSPLVQRYEDLLHHPSRAVRELARHIGLPFRPVQAWRSARAAALPGIRGIASVLPRETWDARTLVHWDHIGNPDGGSWQEWPPDQRRSIEQLIDPLMKRFGYA